MLAYRRRMAAGGSLSRRPRTAWLAVGALVLAAVVGACGDGGSTSTTTTTGPVDPAETTTTGPTTTEPTTATTGADPFPASCPPPPAVAPSGPDDLVFRPVLVEARPGSCDGTPGWLEGGDGSWYQLGPATAPGMVESAEAKAEPLNGGWLVALTFREGRPGIDDFNDLVAECFAAGAGCPTSQVAIVVGDEVLSAPTVQASSFERDELQITGSFTRDEAEALAERIA